MKEEQIKCGSSQIPPAPGYVGRLAELAGCSRQTVHLALRCNAKGVKAEKVRRLYAKLYGNGEKVKIL